MKPIFRRLFLLLSSHNRSLVQYAPGGLVRPSLGCRRSATMKSIGGSLVIILALIGAGCSSTSSTLTSPTPSKCVVATTLSLGTVGAAGGSGRANITAARECAWEASSESPWVVITDGQRGQGDGIV